MKYVYQVEKENYEDAGKASTDIKRTLKTIGIDRRVLKAVAIACYEAEINIVIHSNGGTVTFEIDRRSGISTNTGLFDCLYKSTFFRFWSWNGIV